jgi:hypothetical protein
MFGHLISACDAQVYATLPNKGGNIRSGKEDEGKREVLDESNVEAGVAVELDV